jgi:hypothetical protein
MKVHPYLSAARRGDEEARTLNCLYTHSLARCTSRPMLDS